LAYLYAEVFERGYEPEALEEYLRGCHHYLGPARMIRRGKVNTTQGEEHIRARQLTL